MAIKKKGKGRPRGPKTALIAFRILATDKTALRKKFKAELPPMFKEWCDSLLIK